ncbi:MAG: NUDIX domain-containing protein [Clostridiales bacterium]|jgi:bis(5'-nucleosidyl)-tetraphosphatase|nr:NUDIX domain-containing protein [Clostridiales bacterium]OPZ69556.1 MAG: Diadenosine hexaphosphate hydrolase [Firmicutes bacterium ADurb.Bin467]
MRYEKSCGAVVFRQIGETWHVLLIRHERGHHISFPKGHVEPGENERQTAEREVLEETGIRVSVDMRFRAENRYMARPDVEKLVVFFVGIAGDQEPVAQQGEVAVAEWVDVDQAFERLTYEHDRRILRRALRYVRKGIAK